MKPLGNDVRESLMNMRNVLPGIQPGLVCLLMSVFVTAGLLATHDSTAFAQTPTMKSRHYMYDYGLPPGEIAFSDYGRAIWAADRKSNPDSPQFRQFLAEEFVRRDIIRWQKQDHQ